MFFPPGPVSVKVFRLKLIYPVPYPILGSTLSRISFISLIYQRYWKWLYFHQTSPFTWLASNKFLWTQLPKSFQKFCLLWTYNGRVSHNRTSAGRPGQPSLRQILIRRIHATLGLLCYFENVFLCFSEITLSVRKLQLWKLLFYTIRVLKICISSYHAVTFSLPV